MKPHEVGGRILRDFASALAFLLISSCGPIGLGGGAVLNEDPPPGVVLYQGAFEDLDGSGISGIASVILSTETYTAVIRVGSLAGVESSSAQLQATVDGVLNTISVLRSREGSQNYNTSFDSNHIWADVRIHDPVTDQDLAIALLQKVND